MKNNLNLQKIEFFLIMALFGCLGPLVRAIGLPSPVTACLRAWFAAIALILFIVFSRYRYDRAELKRVLIPMLISGALIATDWIGLFTSYNYTSIATATVSYYIVPILVFLASPFVLKERFTAKHAVCAGVSFLGMVFVSGVIGNGWPTIGEIKGILFAVFGAVSYAGVILLNKKYPSGDALVRTAIQLSVAALITTPYIMLTTDFTLSMLMLKSILLLIVLGVGLTAVTYIVYFYLIVRLPARSVAIFSYADPVVAVLISVFFLSEPITVQSIIGAVLIIGSAIVSEF